MSDEHPDWQDGLLKVLINLEEQYSLWPVERENPPGWRDAGKTGTKAECLEYIGQVWTDMRPLSVRREMLEADSAISLPADVRGAVPR